jgi:hypothetical protein
MGRSPRLLLVDAFRAAPRRVLDRSHDCTSTRAHDQHRCAQRSRSGGFVSMMPGCREALQLLAAGDRARVWIPESLTEPRWPRATLVTSSGSPSSDAPSHRERPSTWRRRRPTPNGPRAGSPIASSAGARVARDPKRARESECTTRAGPPDGALFDSSVALGKPRTVSLRSVMAGWRQGMQ